MSFLRKITRIDRSYANFRRYVEILDIIAKFGFEDLAGAVGWEKVHRLGCKIFWNDRKCENLMITGTRPERVRLLLEALGADVRQAGAGALFAS